MCSESIFKRVVVAHELLWCLCLLSGSICISFSALSLSLDTVLTLQLCVVSAFRLTSASREVVR